TSKNIQDQARQVYGNLTVSKYFEDNTPSALAQIFGHNLYVTPSSWVDADPQYLGGMLMGEILHQLGFSHSKIGDAWHIGGDATHEAIEQKLNHDCFGVEEP